MQLKDHIVLVTGALGTLGSATCETIAAAGGTPIRSDLAGRGKVDISLDVTREADWTEAMAQIALIPTALGWAMCFFAVLWRGIRG